MITPELGGQVITTPWIGNYPGYEYISGIDLAHRFPRTARGARYIYQTWRPRGIDDGWRHKWYCRDGTG